MLLRDGSLRSRARCTCKLWGRQAPLIQIFWQYGIVTLWPKAGPPSSTHSFVQFIDWLSVCIYPHKHSKLNKGNETNDIIPYLSESYGKNFSTHPNLQNQGIHHMYILPRFLRETASAISLRAWPSTASGNDGAAPTPTTTPCNLAAILLIALW